MLVSWLTLALLAADPTGAPRFHRDARFGAFELPVSVPDFRPGDERIYATSPDAKLFALYAAYDEARDDRRAKRGRLKESPSSTASLRVYGRFVDKGEARVEVYLAPAQGSEPGRRIASATLHLPGQRVAAPEVLSGWAEAQNAFLLRQAGAEPGTGLDAYLMERSAAIYGASPRHRSASRDVHTTDAYEVMSGYSAARESLQVDAMRRPDQSQGASVAVASLEGPKIPSHPFEAMRGGRSARMFDAAHAVPAEDWVLHVASPEAAYQMMDLLDAWATDLSHFTEHRSIDHHSQERLFTQLGLSRGDLQRAHQSGAFQALTLAGHDPFFREGTDITVVVTTRDAAALARLIAGTRSVPHAVVQTYRGVQLSVATTPDRRVSSVLANAGNFVFLGNSVDGVKACLDALAGRVPSLAAAPDFLYVRSAGDGGEDAFLYLSDAFVRTLTAAPAKIADQRREVCEHNLQAIAYGRLLAERDRRGPLGMEALVKEGYVPGGLTCPQGGHYQLDEQGPSCSEHGRLSFLTPLVELPVDVVTSAEADSYRAFVQNYRTYWRQFLDPIAVQLRLGPPVTIDTRILPLVDNSIYSAFRGAIAEHPARLDLQGESPKTIAALSAAVEPTPDVRKFVDGFLRDANLVGAEPWRWLGDHASLVIYDGDPIFTVDGAGFPLGGARDPIQTLLTTAVLSSLTLPSALVVQVKDPVRARAALDRLGATLERETASRGSQWLRAEAYRLEDPKGSDGIGVISLQSMGVHVRLYHAVIKDQLYVATRRWLVEDMVRRGTIVPEGGPPAPSGHFRLRVEHTHLKEALSAVRANWGESMRDECFRNLPELGLVHDIAGKPDLVADEERALGATPYCPGGGHYGVNAEGAAFCSLHGRREAPRMPRELSDDTSTARWLGRLAAMDFTLTLDKEGLLSHVVLTPR